MATLPISIQFPTPPTILTQLEAVPGSPFGAGFYNIDRVRGPIGVDAFGFAWTIVGAPAGIGRTVGQTVTTYEQYLVQVLEVKTDFTGATLNGRVSNISQDEGRQFFSEFPITRLAVWVGPASAVNLYWIVLL